MEIWISAGGEKVCMTLYCLFFLPILFSEGTQKTQNSHMGLLYHTP